MVKKFLFIFVLIAISQQLINAEIPPPTDAPKRLSPSESVKTFTFLVEFHLQLAAYEPLISEPSGVCWDARARLFISELHGYNLEVHFNIDELNKIGVLDDKVRCVRDTSKESEKKAETGTVGTNKMLSDSDGDGVTDKAVTWANDPPPDFGICAANEGVIVICAPDIVYLADHNGDGNPRT
jgi:hypothetical protein